MADTDTSAFFTQGVSAEAQAAAAEAAKGATSAGDSAAETSSGDSAGDAAEAATAMAEKTGQIGEYDSSLHKSFGSGKHHKSLGEGKHWRAFGEKSKKNSSAIVSGDNLGKTKVLLLGSGDTYFMARITPSDGTEPIWNEKNHEGALNALITSINLQKDSRSQVNYTIGKTVYIYTLGETLYNLTIGGFGFAPCDTGDLCVTFKQLTSFYDYNNIGKTGKYCVISIGDRQFAGYLTSSDIGLTQDHVGLIPFKFSFIGTFI